MAPPPPIQDAYTPFSDIVHIAPRILPTDPLCQQHVGPDADLTGVGIRLGLYMLCIALSLAAVTGLEHSQSVVMSSITVVLIINIILAMKSSMEIFGSVPIVQDFWVAQTLLFLLTTIVPFTMLFGRWRDLGRFKNVLGLIAILFTYIQAFLFWAKLYTQSDELVCNTPESSLGGRGLFTHYSRWAILVLYSFGSLMMPLMIWSYPFNCPGVFSRKFTRLWLKLPSDRTSNKALLLLSFQLPIYAVCITMVEAVVRPGSDRPWWLGMGQLLVLGIGAFSLAETLWQVRHCILLERRGNEFMEHPEILGGHSKDGDDSDEMISASSWMAGLHAG